MRRLKRAFYCGVFLLAFLTVAGGYPAAALLSSDIIGPSLLDWAGAQPRQYGPGGEEIPFDGTPYFIKYHPEAYSTGEEGGAGGRAWVLKITGSYCKIYIDSNLNPAPNDTVLGNLATQFDTYIWPNNTATFGSCGYPAIDIAIYNFGDGLGGAGGYYAGGDTLYLDSADSSWWDEIAAHEFQHCIHNNKDWNEDLWVNEGCADVAINVCFGVNSSSLESHIYAFEMGTDNDLTKFDNEGYDYGSAYAFLYYFYDHYGGAAAIKSLVADTANGATGFNNRLGGTGKDFTAVFRDWTVANYMNNRTISGVYGYSDLSIKAYPLSIKDYPYTTSAAVTSWAADYFSFRADGEDLTLNFDGTDSVPFEVYVGKFGKGPVPSAVEKMTLNGAKNGTVKVPGLGLNYSEAVMIVSAASPGGTYTFTAISTDWMPPVTNITVTPSVPNNPDLTYSLRPVITMRVNEPKATIFYRFDNGTEQTYSTAFSPPEGEHTLYYHSRDFAGNVEFEKSRTFKVDTTPPVTSLLVSPAAPNGLNGWYNSTPQISLSTEPGGKCFYIWDAGVERNYTEPLKPAEGIHKFYYYSQDLYGNSEPKRLFEFKVDTAGPVSTGTVEPEPDGQNNWYLTAPSVKLETEAGASIVYWWDNDLPADYKLPLTPAEGVHTLHFFGIDRAGNRELPKMCYIRLDSTIPVCGASVTPPAPDGDNGVYRTNVTVKLTTDLGSIALYRWDLGQWTNYTGPLTAPEGKHTLFYYAIDDAGNRASDESLEFYVDTFVPETNISVDPDIGLDWYGSEPSIVLLGEPDASIYYWFDNATPRTYSGRLDTPSGSHILWYYSVDRAGNEEQRHSRQFNVDLMVPSARLSSSASAIVEGQTVSFDGSKSSDTGSGLVLYRFYFGDGEESGWVNSSRMDHKYSKAGAFTAQLRVKDRVGKESEPATVTVNVQTKTGGGGGGGGSGGGDDPGNGKTPTVMDRLKTVYNHPYFPFIFLAITMVIAVAAVAASRRRKDPASARKAPTVPDGFDMPAYAPPPGRSAYRRYESEKYSPAPLSEMPVTANTGTPESHYGETQSTPMYEPATEATAPYSQPEALTWDEPDTAPQAPPPVPPPESALPVEEPVPRPGGGSLPPGTKPASKPRTENSPVDSDIADILKRLEAVSKK